MTILQTTADIQADILFRAGEPTDGTSDFDAVVTQFINRAYRAICHGGGELEVANHEPWLWLKKDPPGVLILDPLYTTGSASVTGGSASVVLSVGPAASVAGWFFKDLNSPDVFRVISHNAGSTLLTLDAGYTGLTAGADSFWLMHLEYSLPSDCYRIISPMRVQQEGFREIDGSDLDSLDRDYPLSLIDEGTPTRFAMVTEQKVRFNKYGMNDGITSIRTEFDYLVIPSDLTNSMSSVPLVPLQYRQVLADYALFLLFTIKNDDRAEGIGKQAKSGIKAMQLENQARYAQFGRNLGHLFTRPANRTKFNQILRTSSGFVIG